MTSGKNRELRDISAQQAASKSGRNPTIKRFDAETREKLDLILGKNDENITTLRHNTDVEFSVSGTTITLTGKKNELEIVLTRLNQKQQLLNEGTGITTETFNEIARQEDAANENASKVIKTPNLTVEARRPKQADWIKAAMSSDIAFGVGPAGTGKTYIGVAAGVALLEKKVVDGLIFVRPALEAGEKLGFLPGDLKGKVDPYMRPIYDALYEMLGEENAVDLINKKTIEIGALGLMRGRTFKKKFILLDEAQNASVEQMKMFLTRFGEGSRMLGTGDPTQNDLPKDRVTNEQQLSGLTDFLNLLEETQDTVIPRVYFEKSDIVRHPVVEHIVGLYEAREEKRNKDKALLAIQNAAQTQEAGRLAEDGQSAVPAPVVPPGLALN